MLESVFLNAHRPASAAPGASPRADRPRGRRRGQREVGPAQVRRRRSESEQRERSNFFLRSN